jgi:uridine kinase
MSNLILVRGAPGSGKSTFVKNYMKDLTRRFAHYEADMYFIDKDGEYRFDGSKIKRAHECVITRSMMLCCLLLIMYL